MDVPASTSGVGMPCEESLAAKRSNKSMSLPPFVDEPFVNEPGQKSEFCWTPANESADHACGGRGWEKSEKLFGKRE
jgi:hypothetical protein